MPAANPRERALDVISNLNGEYTPVRTVRCCEKCGERLGAQNPGYHCWFCLSIMREQEIRL